MPRKALKKQARKVRNTRQSLATAPYGSRRYRKSLNQLDRRFDRFGRTLDRRKGRDVPEDETALYARLYSTKSKKRKANIRRRLKSGSY